MPPKPFVTVYRAVGECGHCMMVTADDDEGNAEAVASAISHGWLVEPISIDAARNQEWCTSSCSNWKNRK